MSNDCEKDECQHKFSGQDLEIDGSLGRKSHPNDSDSLVEENYNGFNKDYDSVIKVDTIKDKGIDTEKLDILVEFYSKSYHDAITEMILSSG